MSCLGKGYLFMYIIGKLCLVIHYFICVKIRWWLDRKINYLRQLMSCYDASLIDFIKKYILICISEIFIT